MLPPAYNWNHFCRIHPLRLKSTTTCFLSPLLEAKLSERRRRNIEARTKLACLPFRKKLDEFDFSFQPSLDERLISELATMAFVQWNEICSSWPARCRKNSFSHHQGGCPLLRKLDSPSPHRESSRVLKGKPIGQAIASL
jgi:hypothetical protein